MMRKMKGRGKVGERREGEDWRKESRRGEKKKTVFGGERG